MKSTEQSVFTLKKKQKKKKNKRNETKEAYGTGVRFY